MGQEEYIFCFTLSFCLNFQTFPSFVFAFFKQINTDISWFFTLNICKQGKETLDAMLINHDIEQPFNKI